MMLARWTATVFALSSSFVAISRFEWPVADELQHLELARGQAVLRSPLSAAGAVDTLGSSTVSPAATRFTAAARSRSSAFFRM